MQAITRYKLVVTLALAWPAVVRAQANTPELWADRVMSVRSVLGADAPQWSPDGTKILFASNVGGVPGLSMIAPDGGAPAKLTDGLGGVPYQLAQQPRWSPTGEYISYVSDKDAGENSCDLWLFSVRDGRHIRLTTLSARIGTTSWSPDGKSIAFSNSLNGNYDIFTVSVPDGVVQRITRDVRYEVAPTWTPDSRSIVYVRTDDHWVVHEILRVPARGGIPTVVTVDPDFFDYNTSVVPSFDQPAISPDGATVVFKSWRSGWMNYWAVPLAGGTPQPVAVEAADNSHVTWSRDGHSIAFTSNHNGTHELHVVAAERSANGIRFGAPRVLVAPRLGVIANIAWAPDGSRISYTLVTPTHPAELFVVSAAGGEPKQLTATTTTADVLDQLVTPEKVSYKSDTLTIHAYLYKPRNAAPGQRFPAILFAHGGPTGQFGDTYDQQMQFFTAQGYVVLAVNFRGGSGYGRAFADANNKCWAHCDLADMVAGVEYLKKQPYINGKFGVTGSSHGGLVAMAAATFAPGVFNATIANSGTADRIHYYNTQELRHIKQADNEFGPLKGNEETYRYVSPFYSAKDANTPILIIWGEGRWPGSDNSKLYAEELDRYYKTHRVKIYTGENYYVAGRANVRQMLLDMVSYFDQYMKNDKMPGTSAVTTPLQ